MAKWTERITESPLWGLLRETFREFKEDKANRLAAALSYYAILSLPPLLLIIVAAASLALNQQAVREQVLNQAADVVGQGGADAVRAMLASAGERTSGGILATIFGVIALLLSATTAFAHLQDALNTAWGIMPKPGRGFVEVLEDRALAVGLIALIAFLLLASLLAGTVIGVIAQNLPGDAPTWVPVAEILNAVLPVIILAILIALVFRYLPDAQISWKDLTIGAVVTTLLFTIGRVALGIYLSQSATASAYGAGGSLILILLWIYYSSLILFVGAEFTQVYARRFGSGITPEEDALKITREVRAEQGIPREETLERAAQDEERPAA